MERAVLRAQTLLKFLVEPVLLVKQAARDCCNVKMVDKRSAPSGAAAGSPFGKLSTYESRRRRPENK